MSVSYIPEIVKLKLWGKSAGCCQYENCRKPLYYDSLTKAEFNTSYIAHIYADQPKGPRWHPTLSELLKSDIANLMLMCDEHHRLIDRAQIIEHPAERLLAMKKVHEEKIELLSSIIPEKRSHIILYGANIGAHGSPLSYKEAASTLLPDRYPVSTRAIELGMKNNVYQDHTEEYWTFQQEQLSQMFQHSVSTLKGNHDVQHFSVFGLAPIPLLIKLGTLLSDIYDADIYQRHREPISWKWQADSTTTDDFFKVVPPKEIKGNPVLNLSLSATITPDRITSQLVEECSIWTVTHANPHNNFLTSKKILEKFREVMRETMNTIKTMHGQNAHIHVFPAMPVSASIEMGRVWMPKADLPMIIYDQNRQSQSFIKTIKIY